MRQMRTKKPRKMGRPSIEGGPAPQPPKLPEGFFPVATTNERIVLGDRSGTNIMVLDIKTGRAIVDTFRIDTIEALALDALSGVATTQARQEHIKVAAGLLALKVFLRTVILRQREAQQKKRWYWPF